MPPRSSPETKILEYFRTVPLETARAVHNIVRNELADRESSRGRTATTARSTPKARSTRKVASKRARRSDRQQPESDTQTENVA